MIQKVESLMARQPCCAAGGGSDLCGHNWLMHFRVPRYNSSLYLFLLLAAFTAWHADAAQPDSIDGEIEKLETGSPIDQQAAMASLAKRGPGASSPLLVVIKGGHDRMARVRATKVLKSILKSSPQAGEVILGDLEKMATDSDTAVADAGITLATEVRSARAIKLIRTAAKNHPNDIVRGKALTSLLVASGRGKSEGDSFAAALKDKSEFVQLRAASALGSVGRKDGLPVCIEILQREPTRKNWSLMIEAAEALGEIGDRSAIPALEKVAKSDTYGPAMGRAKIAIQSIRLAGLNDGAARLALLRESLRQIPLASWAAYQLKALGSAEALDALRQAAAEVANPAQSDVQRVLRQITDEH